MTKIICVKVSKGGVGKTTICANLSYMLSTLGKKVLMIDLDSQANLSSSFKKHINVQNEQVEEKLTSSNLLGDGIFNKENSVYHINDNLDLVVADIGLAEVAKYLESEIKDYFYRFLEVCMNSDLKFYDYIFLDLSPGVADTLTEIALCSSDLIICPMHFDTDSLTGIVLTINDISRLNEANILRKELNYLIVPNRYDKRFEKDNKAIIDMIYENLDREFVSEPIRENSHIKKARMQAMTAIEYENMEERKYEHKRACEDFEKLAKKIESILS